MPNRNRQSTPAALSRGLPAVLLAAFMILAGCSSTTTPTTGDGVDASLPSTSEAPDTTQALDTTQAPDTTQPASNGSGSGGESSDSSDDATGAAVLILLGLVIIGLVVWGASRSGARKGAAEARQQQEAAAYEAEHNLGDEADELPPPPTPTE